MKLLRSRIHRIAGIGVIAWFASGCYSYSRTELNTVPSGSMVRARITAEQAARIEPLLGRADARELDGMLVETSSDTVLLQVPAARRAVSGGGIQVLHQRVTVARAGIVDVELKKLNRGRTVLVAGSGAVALAALVIGAFDLSGSSEGGRGGGGGPDFRVPFMIRLR